VDNDIQRIRDVPLNGQVGEFDAALQHASRKSRNALKSRIPVNCRDGPAMPRNQKLKQIESLAASNLAQDGAVGSVPERCLEKISDCHDGELALLPPSFESKHIRFLNLSSVLDQQDAFIVRVPVSSKEESVGREDLNLGPTDNETCKGLLLS